MNTSELIKSIENRLPELYETAGKDGSHTEQHARKVDDWGKIISTEEVVDSELLSIAALLHDIGYSGTFNELNNHAEESAKKIDQKLPEVKATLDPEEYSALLVAIRNHSLPPQHNNPILDRVLRDADRLDGLGEQGIIRLENVRKFYQVEIEHPTREALKELLRKGILTEAKTSGDFEVRLLGYPHNMETAKGKLIAQELIINTRKKLLEHFPDLAKFMKEFQQKWH